MAGTDLDPERRLTPQEALARAIDSALGSNNWRGYVTYDEDDDVLTIHAPDGTKTTTPVLGGGGGSGGGGVGLSLDPETPADYDAATGVLTLTFTDGSTIETGDLRGADGADGASAFEVAQVNGFTGTEAEWLASLKMSADTSDLPGFTGVTRVVVGDQAAYDGRTPPADDDTILYNIVGDA